MQTQVLWEEFLAEFQEDESLHDKVRRQGSLALAILKS